MILFSSAAFAVQDVKRPEEVFRYKAFTEDNSIVVTWDIEDGYYLYRDKMAYTTGTPGITLGQPVYPRIIAKISVYLLKSHHVCAVFML